MDTLPETVSERSRKAADRWLSRQIESRRAGIHVSTRAAGHPQKKPSSPAILRRHAEKLPAPEAEQKIAKEAEGGQDGAVFWRPSLAAQHGLRTVAVVAGNEVASLGFACSFVKGRCIIKTLTGDGWAAKQGFKVGDHLIEVNGVDTWGMRAGDFKDALSKRPLSMRLYNEVQFAGVPEDGLSLGWSESTGEVEDDLDAMRWRPSLAAQYGSRTTTIVAGHDIENLGFACSFAKGRCVIKTVTTGGWAAMQGFKEGDHLIEVNGSDTWGMPVADFKEAFSKRPLSMRLYNDVQFECAPEDGLSLGWSESTGEIEYHGAMSSRSARQGGTEIEEDAVPTENAHDTQRAFSDERETGMSRPSFVAQHGSRTIAVVAGVAVENLGFACSFSKGRCIIKTITADGWAATQGFKVGDYLIEVNGIDTWGMVAEDFKDALSKRPLSLRFYNEVQFACVPEDGLSVVWSESSDEEAEGGPKRAAFSRPSLAAQHGSRTVAIIAGLDVASLGFACSFVKGRCLIKTITPNGWAAKQGFKVGDHVIEVNGSDTWGMRIEDFKDTLTKRPLSIRLFDDVQFAYVHEDGLSVVWSESTDEVGIGGYASPTKNKAEPRARNPTSFRAAEAWLQRHALARSGDAGTTWPRGPGHTSVNKQPELANHDITSQKHDAADSWLRRHTRGVGARAILGRARDKSAVARPEVPSAAPPPTVSPSEVPAANAHDARGAVAAELFRAAEAIESSAKSARQLVSAADALPLPQYPDELAEEQELEAAANIPQEETIEIPCSERRPVVGDKVFSARGNCKVRRHSKDGVWILREGDPAVVVEVDDDGDFRLLNDEGHLSCWQRARNYVYKDAANFKRIAVPHSALAGDAWLARRTNAKLGQPASPRSEPLGRGPKAGALSAKLAQQYAEKKDVAKVPALAKIDLDKIPEDDERLRTMREDLRSQRDDLYEGLWSPRRLQKEHACAHNVLSMVPEEKQSALKVMATRVHAGDCLLARRQAAVAKARAPQEGDSIRVTKGSDTNIGKGDDTNVGKVINVRFAKNQQQKVESVAARESWLSRRIAVRQRAQEEQRTTIAEGATLNDVPTPIQVENVASSSSLETQTNFTLAHAEPEETEAIPMEIEANSGTPHESLESEAELSPREAAGDVTSWCREIQSTLASRAANLEAQLENRSAWKNRGQHEAFDPNAYDSEAFTSETTGALEAFYMSSTAPQQQQRSKPPRTQLPAGGEVDVWDELLEGPAGRFRMEDTVQSWYMQELERLNADVRDASDSDSDDNHYPVVARLTW